MVAASLIATDLGIAQRIAGHLSISSTRHYTKLLSIRDSLRIAAQVVVPGLADKFGKYDDSQVTAYYEEQKVKNARYAKLDSTWFSKLCSQLYT